MNVLMKNTYWLKEIQTIIREEMLQQLSVNVVPFHFLTGTPVCFCGLFGSAKQTKPKTGKLVC